VALRSCPLVNREGPPLREGPVRRGVRHSSRHCTIELGTTFARRRVEREKLSRVTKALVLRNAPCPRNRDTRVARRPVSAGRRERSPSTASSRRTEGTRRSITRISSFAGRVTEAAVPRKGECSGRTCGALALRNAYDVVRRHASPARRQWVPVETVSRGSRRFTLSRKRTCQRASSTHSLPTTRRHVPRKGQTNARAARKPPYPATDRRWDAPPGADEGVKSA
jgi:hypothetical protein